MKITKTELKKMIEEQINLVIEGSQENTKNEFQDAIEDFDNVWSRFVGIGVEKAGRDSEFTETLAAGDLTDQDTQLIKDAANALSELLYKIDA